MNWDRIAGSWSQLTGAIREKWGDLTDDDLDRIGDKRKRLDVRLRDRYPGGRRSGLHGTRAANHPGRR